MSRHNRVSDAAVYPSKKHRGNKEDKDRPAADHGDSVNAPGVPGRAPSGRCLHWPGS